MLPTKNTPKALAELSPNTTSPSKASSNSDLKEKSSKPAVDILSKMPATAAFPIHTDHTSNYISPSDNVMSPTSKKLSEIKGRRIAGAKSKQLNGRELFAKVRAQNEKNTEPISPMSLSHTESQGSTSQSFSDSS